MNSEFIHPFIDAAVKVIEEATETKAVRGVIEFRTSPIPAMGVASIIGILGEAEGRMVMDMSPETACKLSSAMNEQPIEAFEDLAASTINELANMIGGRAVSELVNKGHRLDITPPTIFTGRDMEVSNTDIDTVIIPIDTVYGRIILNIAVRPK